MSKTSLSIRMLEILYSRDVISIAELASALDTNPRNVPEYKKELEQAGYYIESVPGRYGGYRLHKKVLFPAVALSKGEKQGLIKGFEHLLAQKDFMYRKEYAAAMEKIAAVNLHENFATEPSFFGEPVENVRQSELEEYYLLLSDAIKKKVAVEITYVALDRICTTRYLHPYKLFHYHKSWYVLGFDEMDRDIRYFKLGRIQKMQQTGKPFRVLYTYRERDYLDEFGMKRHGDYYAVKLKLSGVHAMLARERTYGKKQNLQETKDGVLLCCEMQNKALILQFVLGCGSDCTVLEPQWLRDEVCLEAERLQEKYRKEDHSTAEYKNKKE